MRPMAFAAVVALANANFCTADLAAAACRASVGVVRPGKIVWWAKNKIGIF